MLNFKDWKISSQDGTKATLTHANGHQMVIAMKALPKIQREQIMRLAKANEYKDGSTDQEGSPDTVQASDSGAGTQPVQPSAPTVVINAGGAQPQTPVSQFANQATAAPAPVVRGLPSAKEGEVLNPTGQPNPAAIQQAGQAAVQGQSQIDAAKAAALVPAEKAHIEAQAQIQDKFQHVFDQLNDETTKFSQDTNGGVIDPQHWWKVPGIFGETGAPKKALAGIGLILGGVGAGQLGTTDNPAMRALNERINQDIESQQKTFGNQRTILSAYQDLFGHSQVATNMAKNALAEIYKSQIDLVDKQLGTPQSRVNAIKLKADIAQDQLRRNKENATDITEHAGYAPSYRDTGATNAPQKLNIPGVQGPTTAQGAPTVGSQMLQANQGHVSPSPELAGAAPKPHTAEEMMQEPIEPILKPAAERFVKQGAQYSPSGGNQLGEVRHEYDRAYAADKVLSSLNRDFTELARGAEEGGVGGRVSRTGGHALSALGSLLPGHQGEAIGAGAPVLLGTETNRLYEANKTKLFGDISSVLKGIVGDGLIREVVDKNAPEYGDSAEAILHKKKNIEAFIKKHATTPRLHEFKVTNG